MGFPQRDSQVFESELIGVVHNRMLCTTMTVL